MRCLLVLTYLQSHFRSFSLHELANISLMDSFTDEDSAYKDVGVELNCLVDKPYEEP